MKKLLTLTISISSLIVPTTATSRPATIIPSPNPVCSGIVAAPIAAPITAPSMQSDLLQMLANFTTYMKADFQDCVEPNSIGERCGCFRGENTMANDERGVRPNADLSMICAFLAKYGKGKVTLPSHVSWDDIESMAMKSLVFSYSTHKANKLKVCKGNNYWGSTAASDAVWESSLWAMSVAYSAFFQWDKLTKAQKNYIYELLKAECNYELERSIPTGYAGDTKAEENGWEADVLAVTLGLFPNDALAPRWFERLREFAINSYSQKDDAQDNTIIDPDYDNKTVKDLYRGQNLYDDFTLQNHNYFHTSYQNVVIQELGEAALALKLFQKELYGTEKWKTNALMHNNDRVMKDVLYWLALSDGELAMPNGNDWSLFLYDQITSYSTNACFLRDPHALMLENLAYQMIKARQQTTKDGSWLLRADVGARRMGVEAHRVMMTYLMHEVLPTTDLTPTSWADFSREYSSAKLFSSQNIVRAASPSRFTCFSWSNGLRSYTGYIAPTVPDTSPSGSSPSVLSPSATNFIVPFRSNNTGNFIGWYDVKDKHTNATPVVPGIYDLQGNSYVMNGELQTNDASLNNRFVIYSTPGNAVVYMDYVRTNNPCTISAEKGGLMAISMDELTRTSRTFYAKDSIRQLDGTSFTMMNTPWLNIDNTLGIITLGTNTQMAFGDCANNNSINTAKLYTLYNGNARSFEQNAVVGKRTTVYYSNTTADVTKALYTDGKLLDTPEGWNGAIVADTDGSRYLLLSNFCGKHECQLKGINTPLGCPVFAVETTINKEGSAASFSADENHAIGNWLRCFIKGNGLTATQAPNDPSTIFIQNTKKGKNTITVNTVSNGKTTSKKIRLGQERIKITID